MASLGYLKKGPKVIPNEGNNGGGGAGGNRLDDYDIVIRINTIEGEPANLDVIKSDISAFERYENDEIPVNIFVYTKTDDNQLISYLCDYSCNEGYIIQAYTMYVTNAPGFVSYYTIVWDPEEETWFLD